MTVSRLGCRPSSHGLIIFLCTTRCWLCVWSESTPTKQWLTVIHCLHSGWEMRCCCCTFGWIDNCLPKRRARNVRLSSVKVSAFQTKSDSKTSRRSKYTSLGKILTCLLLMSEILYNCIQLVVTRVNVCTAVTVHPAAEWPRVPGRTGRSSPLCRLEDVTYHDQLWQKIKYLQNN